MSSEIEQHETCKKQNQSSLTLAIFASTSDIESLRISSIIEALASSSGVLPQGLKLLLDATSCTVLAKVLAGLWDILSVTKGMCL